MKTKEVMPPKKEKGKQEARVSVLALATQRRGPAARNKANSDNTLRLNWPLQTATNCLYGSIKTLLWVMIERT
jgi:hypothetical protein